MKFRTRLYLFTTILIVVTTFSVLFAGMAIINGIITHLNNRVLFLEVNKVVEQIDDAYNVLRESGLDKVEAYRNSAKKELAQKLARYKFGKSGRICILNKKGQPVINPAKVEFAGKKLEKVFSSKTGSVAFAGKNRLQPKDVGVFASAQFNWKVVLLVNHNEMFAKRDLYFRTVSLIGGLSLLAALSVAYIFSNKLSRQISEILACLKKVSKGDLDSIVNIASPFSEEHKELQHGINSMIEDLRARERERKLGEEEMIKHQKMESLSLLAGGIAHDFNNLLTAIRGNVQLAQMYHMEDDLKECLFDSETATIRAMDLTKQLLTFSKGGSPLKKAASITEILKHSGTFVLRGTNSKCEFEFPKDLKAVDIDSSQISQVINNIIINANQAMPKGGIVKIKAENFLASEDSKLPLLPEEYVAITITDHGQGIEESFISKIFDPFFTTKESGTGLGLSSSYSIIKKHAGHISVDSEPGIGTRFKIYLPVSKNKINEGRDTTNTHFVGGGKILVMDDQPTIRNLLGKMLSKMNCKCEFAESGENAVKMYTEALNNNEPFDLVLADLTIPGGMGGKDMLLAIQEITPNAKAIVTSGYINDPVMANYEEYGFQGRLEKPFRLNDLKKLLKNLLATEESFPS